MINFTGTTRKRNVNLSGTRRLGNKNEFLQNAEQERKKRLEQKRRIKAAVVIQSALRSYISRVESQRGMYENWGGQTEVVKIKQFNYFHPYYCKNDINNARLQSQAVLGYLQENGADCLSETTFTQLVNCMILSLEVGDNVGIFFETFHKRIVKHPQGIHFSRLLRCIVYSLFDSDLFQSLFYLYMSYDLSAAVKVLQDERVAGAVSEDAGFSEFYCTTIPLLSRLDNKSPVLSNISLLIHRGRFHAVGVDLVVDSIIQLCGDSEVPSFYFSKDFALYVQKGYIGGQVSDLMLTSLFCGLGASNSQLLINIIVYFIPLGFLQNLYTLVSSHFEDTLMWDQDGEIFLVNSFVLLQELYSSILTVTNDLDLFKGRFLSHPQFISFVAFLKKSTVSAVLADKTPSSLKLLNQVHLRDIRLKLLPDGFWTLENQYNANELIPLVVEMEVGKAPKRMPDGLKILLHLPFLLPFHDRVRIFHTLIELDRRRLLLDGPGAFFRTPSPKLEATISRQHLLRDSFESFRGVSGDVFKNQLSIHFINEFGPEAGIDGGGLTKELLTSVCKEGFHPETGLFKATDNYQIYPNPEIFWLNQDSVLPMMRFLGLVIGKCIYANILIDISFAPFFISKWCEVQYKSSFDDLRHYDFELYSNLVKLLKMSPSEIEALDLNFTVQEKLEKEILTKPLIPHGDTVKVTSLNKLQYAYSVANFKISTSISTASQYFLNGLFSLIKPHWIQMFNPLELQMLISGREKEIDVADLKNHVELGGFLESDQTILDLFDLLNNELSSEEKGLFVKFVTSSSKAPLLGFQELDPKFGIRNVGYDSKSRLPTASTCVNLLKLPDYRDKQLLKTKLLYAIKAEAGFDLS